MEKTNVHLAGSQEYAAAAPSADERTLTALDYATALLEVMDGMQDHDIADATGLPLTDCQRIAAVRADSQRRAVHEHG
jgi:hypothetical protein